MTYLPNTFQNPNVIVDRVMFLLTEPELKCLLFAIRHILGWQDVIEYRRPISLSWFMEGFTDGKGNVYSGTGLCKTTIRIALISLEKYGLIKRTQEKGRVPDIALPFMTNGEIDFAGLQARFDEKQNKRQKSTQKWQQAGEKARAEAVNPSSKTERVQSDNTPIVTLNAPPSSATVGVGVQSDYTHINPREKPNETQERKDNAPSEPSEDQKAQNKTARGLIQAWLKTTGAVNPQAYALFQETAVAMVKQGIIPADIYRYVPELKKEPFWKDKTPKFNYIAENIAGWLATHPEKPPEPDKPEQFVVPPEQAKRATELVLADLERQRREIREAELRMVYEKQNQGGRL